MSKKQRSQTSLSEDQLVRHKAWLDLGHVLDLLERNELKEIEKLVQDVRESLFVPGNHNVRFIRKITNNSSITHRVTRHEPRATKQKSKE
jgi:metallophosphoesterase superfamily enzyme